MASILIDPPTWERHYLSLSANQLEGLVHSFLPNTKTDRYQLMTTGLANTNIKIELKGHSLPLLLRIYTRDKDALKREVALARQWGPSIAMPKILYWDDQSWDYSYALVEWIEGQLLSSVLQSNISGKQLEILAVNTAKALYQVHAHAFAKAGELDEHLQPQGFGDEGVHQDPFLVHIQECLFKGKAGTRLGDLLRDQL